MKKLKLFALAIGLATLSSCEKETLNSEMTHIFNYINALPTVQKTTVSEINSLNNTTLVKLQ